MFKLARTDLKKMQMVTQLYRNVVGSESYAEEKERFGNYVKSNVPKYLIIKQLLLGVSNDSELFLDYVLSRNFFLGTIVNILSDLKDRELDFELLWDFLIFVQDNKEKVPDFYEDGLVSMPFYVLRYILDSHMLTCCGRGPVLDAFTKGMKCSCGQTYAEYFSKEGFHVG